MSAEYQVPMRPWLWIFQIAVVLLCAVGCEHDDSEDHLEHIIPAHKPHNFASCVEQLRLRGEEYYSGELSEAQVDKLRDIVNWVPELAADSDLNRQQWERAQQISKELNDLASRDADPKGRVQWKKLVSQLIVLVPYAEKSFASAAAESRRILAENTHVPSGDELRPHKIISF